MVLHRSPFRLEHRKYSNVVDYINEGDVVVLNDTKVIKARLFGNPKGKSSRVEILLLSPLSHMYNLVDLEWEVLIGNAGKLKNVDLVELLPDLTATVLQKTKHNTFKIRFSRSIEPELDKIGHVPLPRYIKRVDTESDETRYQTVFATVKGSVAAPTASLNLTKDILKKIKDKGAKIVYVTLYVGWGTFAPIKTEFVEDFKIHKELATISRNTFDVIKTAQERGGKIIAFGTTVTRVLEGVHQKFGELKEYSGELDIFIYPPFEFKVVDKLVTNFHAPGTTVLLMAAAFAGRKNLFKAYKEALAKDYEFLSYGDSMFIQSSRDKSVDLGRSECEQRFTLARKNN